MGCGSSTHILINQSKSPYQNQAIPNQTSRNKNDGPRAVKIKVDINSSTIRGESAIPKHVNMASIEKAFLGDLNVEFTEDINIVRIFTSSTFTDTSVERNTLMSRVYPRIKTFCQEKGYDFQVVDLRWGIREESMDDHSMSELCMKELQACQKLSTGPNFITFLGQKYGYRPLPSKIEAVEFEQLIPAIEDPEDVELVKDWYQEDDNSVPSDYVLQPISSRLVHFRDHEHAHLRDEAAAQWMKVYRRLHSILSKAADKVLAPDVARKYHMSVTEHEIRRGVMESSCPEKQCFWFKRVIKDLRQNISKPKAPFFIDVVRPETTIDETAQNLLDNLKAQEIVSLLPKDNIIQYEIHWSEEGIDPESSKEHEKYIDELCDNFYEVLTKTINDGIEKKKSVQPKDLLTKELYHQGMFCKRRYQSFHGRKEFLSTVEKKLLNDEKRTLVIHGESGCGKTSIMAKIASEMSKWIIDKFQHPEDSYSIIEPCVVVYRFLGTSPDSSSPRLLLHSICEQLCRVSAQPIGKIPQDMKSLTEYFPNCLATAASSHPIVLILDSLDQITGQGWSQELNWWPKVLPKNVYAVLSTLPGREFHCLSYLKSYLPPHCFLKVPKMTYEEAEVILDSWLNSVKRVLQPQQKKIVLDGFKDCQLPLYLKLTFDEASRWKSYTPENETQIGADVEAIINSLFDRLENEYGKILVSQAFGYITASRSGLTELELDDLLSLDDTVLNDIYQYWTPPIRRMLPLLWFRLHADVEDYLIKRGADGVPVVYWYHRQFIKTAKKRYLNPEKADELHKSMVEYYVGKWADGKKKPYINENGDEIPMDRLVASQPVMYDANPEQPVFNKRKLNELPYHMIHARQLNDLKKEAFCNFDFLSAKLQATSLEELLEDFAFATSIFDNDDELQVVNRFFQLSSMALRNDRNQFASQIIGRLGPFITRDNKHPFVGELVKQAQSSSITGLPNFVTSEKCLSSPGGALISSLTVNDQNACCSFSCDRVHVFVGSSNKEGLCLQVLVSSTGKVVREFSLNLPEKDRAYRWTLKASALHKDLVLVGGAQTMILLDTNTKHVVKTFNVLKESMKNFFYPFAFVNGEKQITAISDEGVKIWNTDDRKVVHFSPLPGITVDTVKALDAQGKWVVYSVQDDGFNVLNVEDGNQETIFKLQDTIKEIKITQREEIVVLTSKRKKLHIFDLNSKGLIREVSEFECYFGINRLKITMDGTKAVSFTDKDILISSLENGQVQRVAKTELFEENIDCTQIFSDDGVNLFAVGYDKVLRIYHLDKVANNDRTINQMSERSLLSGTISSVYPSYGNRYLPTKTITNGQKELTIWDVKGNKPKRVRCLRHEEGINELRMCTPTRAVAKFFSEGSQNCGFGVLDLKEGKIERYLPGDANLLWSVGFTDDVHFMAFSREKRRLQVWDINKGVVTFKHRFEKNQPISQAIMNKEHSYVICGLVRNEKMPHKSLPLIAFDCSNNKHHVLKIKKQQLTLRSASISHDGKILIALTFETVPTLWDVPSGKLLFILPTDSVHATGVSSLKNLAITCRGDTDAVLQIWSIDTGCILSQFDTEPAHKILMNVDENVAYTFQGNNFYAWDLSSGKRTASLTMDWAPIPRHVFGVGNAVVVPIPEAPLITTLRLQGQGYDGGEVESCVEAYGDVTVDGKLLLS